MPSLLILAPSPLQNKRLPTFSSPISYLCPTVRRSAHLLAYFFTYGLGHLPRIYYNWLGFSPGSTALSGVRYSSLHLHDATIMPSCERLLLLLPIHCHEEGDPSVFLSILYTLHNLLGGLRKYTEIASLRLRKATRATEISQQVKWVVCAWQEINQMPHALAKEGDSGDGSSETTKGEC